MPDQLTNTLIQRALGGDIDLPPEFVGPQLPPKPKDPMTALSKAATIGASKVGERYAEPTNPGLLDIVRNFVGGAARPRTVQAQDPYGIEAWSKGAGPVPGLMMGSTEEVGEPVQKAVAGIKGLFSRAEEGAKALPEVAHPAKMQSALKSMATQEELDMRGVNDMLKDHPGNKMTKGEVQSFLDANPPPQIGVKTLGEPRVLPRISKGGDYGTVIDQRTTSDGLGRKLFVTNEPDMPYIHMNQMYRGEAPAEWRAKIDEYGSPIYADSPEELVEKIKEAFDKPRLGPAEKTKWGRDSLVTPGGENYKERLLTLPNQNQFKIDDPEAFKTWFKGHYGMEPDETDFNTKNVDDLAMWKRSGAPISGGAPYESGHWDDPDVFAHSRFNERELPDTPLSQPNKFGHTQQLGKKGRFIEEVQSDWHQTGKREGYSTGKEDHQRLLDELEKEYDNVDSQIGNAMHARDDIGTQWIHENPPKGMLTDDQLYAAREKLDRLQRDHEEAYNVVSSGQRTYSDHVMDPETVARQRVIDELDKQIEDSGDAYHKAMRDLPSLNEFRADPRFAEWQQHNVKENLLRYRLQEISRQQNEVHTNVENTVPDAPFKESWPDLVLKEHVLDVAKRPDLDWIGLTHSSTQIQRNAQEIQKHVSQLDYDPVRGILSPTDIHGDVMRHHNVKPEALHTYIGQDLADKIINNPTRKWKSGDNSDSNLWHNLVLDPNAPIDINSKAARGSKFFYDQRLPSSLNKILKPFGGKVELGELQTPPPKLEPHYSYLDPQDRYTASPGGYHVGQVWSMGEHDGPQVASAIPRIPESENSALDAKNQGRQLIDLIHKTNPSFNGKIPAWIAHLTPEMKRAILEKGLPFLTLMGALKGTQQEQPSDLQNALVARTRKQ